MNLCLFFRKKNGQVHVFDETLTDNDSQASDITYLEEHLRGMPAIRDISTYAESSVSMVSSRSRKGPLPAFIRPSTAQPHTKGIRKCDPVSRLVLYCVHYKFLIGCPYYYYYYY